MGSYPYIYEIVHPDPTNTDKTFYIIIGEITGSLCELNHDQYHRSRFPNNEVKIMNQQWLYFSIHFTIRVFGKENMIFTAVKILRICIQIVFFAKISKYTK